MSIILHRTVGVGMSIVFIGVAIFMFGCGSMNQTKLNNRPNAATATIPQSDRVPVVLGEIIASIDQPEDVRAGICRYLKDLALAEIGQHGIFLLVDTNKVTSSLLSEYGLDGNKGTEQNIKPQGVVDVEITSLQEKSGATVRVAFVSSQKKHAVAGVKVVLRSLNGGSELVAVRKGKASKGAWGVITTVNREAMKGGAEEWEMDGSMIAVASANAIRAAVDNLAKQTRFRVRETGKGVEKRLLRPRAKIR